MTITQKNIEVQSKMEPLPENTQKPLTLIVEDRVQLHNHYMPFIEAGAIFIPTTEAFKLGDEAKAVIFLKQYNKKIPISGQICWLNACSDKARDSHQKQGVGIQLTGEKAPKIKALFEKVLGDLVNHKPKLQVY